MENLKDNLIHDIFIHELPEDVISNKNNVMEIIVIDEYCKVYDSLTHFIYRKELGYANKYDIYEGEKVLYDRTDVYYKIWFNGEIGFIGASHLTWFEYKYYEAYGMIPDIIKIQKNNANLKEKQENYE